MLRRDFLKKTCGTLVAVPITGVLLGCADDDDDLPRRDAAPVADGPTGDIDARTGDVDASQLTCSETIGTNHGHTVEVPEADVQAGIGKTYGLTIGIDHTHMLTLSNADMATLGTGGSVMVESSVDASTEFGSHAHIITVTCA